MLLAIDCGNTNTLFAIHDGADWVAQWRSGTDSTRTADEHAVWLTQLMALQGRSFGDITACVISTVVPQALFNLRNLSRRYFKAEPVIVGEPGVRMDIEVRLDRPQDAGADRLVNALGARAVYHGALIIIDSGTATTFDVIDGNGNYTGGLITPGINLSQEALHMAAAKLPRVAICRPDRVIGKGTVEAMQSGIYWGYLSMIEGVVKRIEDEFGSKMKVVATGGLAPLFAESTDRIDCADGELTLRGLFAIHQLNEPSK